MQALYEAIRAVALELDMGELLQRLVDVARELAGAQYGALAVFNEELRITQFLTSGIS